MSDPQSRNEAILQNILGEENELDEPQSRNEAILQAILNGTDYEDEPQSRIEELLIAIKEGGGSGGSDHTIEDALIQNTPMDEYYNDRVTEVVGEYKFAKCKIKKLYLPNVTKTVGNYNFQGGDESLLEELYLPNIVTSGWNSYLNNPNLRIADIGKTFGGGKITGCPNLEILIIRDANLKAVGNNWLTGTPLASDGTGGYVYVPQNLLDAYQNSEAWQTYANVLEFRPIEGSEYE